MSRGHPKRAAVDPTRYRRLPNFFRGPTSADPTIDQVVALTNLLFVVIGAVLLMSGSLVIWMGAQKHRRGKFPR